MSVVLPIGQSSLEVPEGAVDDLVRCMLQTVRVVLGADAVILAVVRGDRLELQYVDAVAGRIPVARGDSVAFPDSYGAGVLTGELPAPVPDVSRNPAARALTERMGLPAGAIVSVPPTAADGELQATLTALIGEPDPLRGSWAVRLLARTAHTMQPLLSAPGIVRPALLDLASQLRTVVAGGRVDVHFQPIVLVEGARMVGVEALARIFTQPYRSPLEWFSQARASGLEEYLEIAVLRRAVDALVRLPEDVYLSLNVSPGTLTSEAMQRLLGGLPLRRIVLEVTEHQPVAAYAALHEAVDTWRARGLRLAVDDAGAGFASFRHILQMRPDIIKLDTTLIRRVDMDASSRALAAALVRFAEETGSAVVAEGVETTSQLQVLADLHVSKAQGYLLGRPGPLGALL